MGLERWKVLRSRACGGGSVDREGSSESSQTSSSSSTGCGTGWAAGGSRVAGWGRGIGGDGPGRRRGRRWRTFVFKLSRVVLHLDLGFHLLYHFVDGRDGEPLEVRIRWGPPV